MPERTVLSTGARQASPSASLARSVSNSKKPTESRAVPTCLSRRARCSHPCRGACTHSRPPFPRRNEQRRALGFTLETNKDKRAERYAPVYPEGHGALIHAAVGAQGDATELAEVVMLFRSAQNSVSAHGHRREDACNPISETDHKVFVSNIGSRKKDVASGKRTRGTTSQKVQSIPMYSQVDLPRAQEVPIRWG